MKNALAKRIEDAYLPSLHLSTVELRCELREKLHRVTWPCFGFGHIYLFCKAFIVVCLVHRGMPGTHSYYLYSALTVMAFVTSSERISLVLTSLVSMFFFMKMVTERTPSSDTVPLLSIYYVMLSFEVRTF